MRKKISEQEIKLIFGILFIFFLLFLIMKGLWQYLSAFFAIGVLYVLFGNLNDYLREKTFLKRKGAALATIIISILIVIIPSFLIIGAAVNQLSGSLSDPKLIIASVQKLDALIPGINLISMLSDQVPKMTEFIANVLIDSISDVTHTIFALVIIYFLLYFIFIEDKDKLKKQVLQLIPFSKKNSEKLIREFEHITNATLISAGLMALVQGLLLGILFALFGIQGAIFWGLLGAFLSFLPIVGPALIWVPVVLIELTQGRITPAIIIAAGGLFIAYIDNLLRPFLNRKIGRINQVVSLLGIFMGFAVFGIIGVIIGPIIISFFLLTIKMFKEEYLNK